MVSVEGSDAVTEPSALLTLAMIRRYYLPVGERTIFRLISAGRFPRADIRLGGKIRLWKRETIESWISAQGNKISR